MSKTTHVHKLSVTHTCRQYLTVSVKVTATRRFKLRTWVAIRPMKVAMRILPGNNRVEVTI